MDIARVSVLQEEYKQRLPTLDRTISRADDMFKKSGGWNGYLYVGTSAVDVILQGLVLADLQEVRTILDFGCGYGRTGRHLPVLFPDATLLFSDLDASAWTFCARQFPRAEGIPSHEDFAQVDLPENIDIIFVGSLFTHLDWNRSRALWTRLFAALAPNGCLISTFHGLAYYRSMTHNPEQFNPRGYYNRMIQDYLATGFGYQIYRDYTSWGQSLSSIARVTELATGSEAGSARLVGYKEAGWASFQDAAIWTKCAVHPAPNPAAPRQAKATLTGGRPGRPRSWRPKRTWMGWMRAWTYWLRSCAMAAKEQLERWLR